YAPRELDDHSFGPEDIASMSVASEAALGQLGLIERNDLATMAIGYQSKPSHEEGAIRPRPERGFFSGAVIARAFGLATRLQLGGISVQHPVTRRRHLDNEQKSRDAQFAPKNGQNPKPSRWPADRSSALSKARNHPPRRDSFFNLKTSNSELGGRASG